MDFLKLRVKGRSSYRFYYLMIVRGENIYLGHLHPKTGKYGTENITQEAEHDILADIQRALHSRDLYRLSHTDSQISFHYLPDEEE